jgi:nicotinamidase/pyrazinamidase
MNQNRALLLVDIQNDFCSGGNISIPQGDSIVPVCNAYIGLFTSLGLPVFASRDWHPEKSKHFQNYGGIWPAHCVQNSYGASFHPRLRLPLDACIVSKGQGPNEESYSAFQGRDYNGALLNDLFQQRGITELFVGGLATDFCVKHTVLDALHKNYSVKLLIDAIKGLNSFFTDDAFRSIGIMVRYGAVPVEINLLRISIPASKPATIEKEYTGSMAMT